MFQLARWLVRHLDDPRLVIWIAQHGGQLLDRWPWLIENQLDHFDALSNRDDEEAKAELDEIRSQAPRAIPSPFMRTLWNLLLCGRIKSPRNDSGLFRWKDHLKRNGLTTTLRLELRELLAPRINLKKPFPWEDILEGADEADRRRNKIDCELVLSTEYAYSELHEYVDKNWNSALPFLIEDFQLLLRDALDLLRDLGAADDHNDSSYWDLPSISPHSQNIGLHDWVILIELPRDAWLEIYNSNRSRATSIAQSWFEQPYPTFKRLAFFAASYDNCIEPEQWVSWLMGDGAWWLWSVETAREVFRLLVLQGHQLAGTTQELLETAILTGPPRKIYLENLDQDKLEEEVSYSIWLHLAKLKSSGLELGSAAEKRLDELSRANPKWQVEENESDEFSHWSSGTGFADYEENYEVVIAPRKRDELVQWLLTKQINQTPFYEDTWPEVCRNRFFHSLFALCDLHKAGKWPVKRWRVALQVWSEEGLAQRSWDYAAPLVQDMPDTIFQDIINGVAWWLHVVSKPISHHEDILLDLCDRVFEIPIKEGNTITRDSNQLHDPVTKAINHPIGLATQALINLWHKQKPNDDDRLPVNIEPLFRKLCNIKECRFQHGRVLLGSQLITFFRVDRSWTKKHLLPLFDWSRPDEAKAVWEGFLSSPRVYRPLLQAFKPQFLSTAKHYSELGVHKPAFAFFLTYVALEATENFTDKELRSAIGTLPQDGLEESARALYQILEGAANQREDYWINHVQPFWQKIWPKSRDLATQKISEYLALLIIASQAEFPAALSALQDWLQPIDHPHYVVLLLDKSGICSMYPEDALSLLDSIINTSRWLPQKLQQCLEDIVRVNPSLERDVRYNRLREYVLQNVP